MAFRELCEALETLQLQHEQLLILGEQKKDALIHNNLTDLNERVNKESRLVKLINDTDRRRIQAVIAWQAEQGFSQNPGVKLAELISMITNSDDKLKLMELAEQLTVTVERLKALNDINMRLTEQSIEFNDYSLNLLTGMYEDDDFVYKKPSDQSQSQIKLKLFDSRV